VAYIAQVRYGKMLLVAKFKSTILLEIKPREKCVVKTDRGTELGVLLTSLREIAKAETNGFGEILRKATKEDLELAEKIEKEIAIGEEKFAKENIQKLNLPINLVDVEHLLDGRRIIFYFTSAERVDFRELVKILAQEFKTRIEMRQIGARDEAKLLADVGHCGLPLCCKSFLKELGGLSINMAKAQKRSIDPSKITGRCGKLFCCLKYEFQEYQKALNVLPIIGAKILSKKGDGKVVDQNPMAGEVTIEDENGKKVIVKLDDIIGNFETPKTLKEEYNKESSKDEGILL